MKNETLKKLIKEEIKNILKENLTLAPNPNIPSKTKDTGQEKVSGADFNKALFDFNKNLRANKSGLGQTELKNLLDIFDLMVAFAREYSLTQAIENRLVKIVDANGKLQKQMDNPED
jgi:hypothetical protein